MSPPATGGVPGPYRQQRRWWQRRDRRQRQCTWPAGGTAAIIFIFMFASISRIIFPNPIQFLIYNTYLFSSIYKTNSKLGCCKKLPIDSVRLMYFQSNNIRQNLQVHFLVGTWLWIALDLKNKLSAVPLCSNVFVAKLAIWLNEPKDWSSQSATSLLFTELWSGHC